MSATLAPPHRPATHSTAVAPAFVALVLAMLPAVLDQTVLATALPTIAGALGTIGDVTYVVTPTSSPPRWRRPCGASSATATAAARCSPPRSSSSSPRPRAAG